MNPENLAIGVKKIQLELALLVKSICEENGIKYFLIAGTALGAVRHNGFIPWDDDIDIGIPRDDYNKFLLCANDYMKDKFFLQTLYSDEKYPNTYAKLRANKTRYVERATFNNGSHDGIFVDIFPIDNVPKNYIYRSLQKISNVLLKYTLYAQCKLNLYSCHDEFLKYMVFKYIFGFFANLFTRKRLIFLHEFIVDVNKAKCSDLVILGGSYGYEKERFPAIWFSEGIYINFEGLKFVISTYWHEYLSHMYGEYMIPPSVDKRKGRHDVILIEL